MNARTIIKLYWTTDPECMGYGNNPHKWEPTGKPMLKGTPRTILTKWEEEKRKCGLNGGVYYTTRLYAEGKEVQWEDILSFLAEQEFDKYNGRR